MLAEYYQDDTRLSLRVKPEQKAHIGELAKAAGLSKTKLVTDSVSLSGLFIENGITPNDILLDNKLGVAIVKMAKDYRSKVKKIKDRKAEEAEREIEKTLNRVSL